MRLASVVPARIERWLIERLLGPDVDALDQCLNSGLLMPHGAALGFRHELARVAVESSLGEPVAQSLHAAVLQALEHDPPQPVSTARRVHHATHAGDVAAVLRLAPEAARQAEARGAHREAAAHWRTALDHARDTRCPMPSARAWLDASARECQSIDQLDEAIAARLSSTPCMRAPATSPSRRTT